MGDARFPQLSTGEKTKILREKKDKRMERREKDGEGGEGVGGRESGFVSVLVPGDLVVSSLDRKVKSLDEKPFNRNPPTIHKIHNDIRKGNEGAYTPKLFSIGPYHHLQETEDVKLLFLKNLLDRNPDNNKVEKYASAIKSREEEARDCYYDRCKGVESKDFVEMMVLDGCFIIEFLLKRLEGNVSVPLTSQLRNLPVLHDDLMLMENQIPFFILKLILDNSKYRVQGVVGGKLQILDLSLNYLLKGKIKKEMLDPFHQEDDGKNIYNLLHLNYLCHMVEINPEMESPPDTFHARLVETLRSLVYVVSYGFLFLIKWFLLLFLYALIFLLKSIKLAFEVMWQKPTLQNRPRVKAKKVKGEAQMVIPTATELKESGMIFKRKEDAKNSLDVTFLNGVMEIPVISVQANSNSKFRNFLALEQNCLEVGNNFTSFVVFMDNLIDTPADVALLKKKSIIESKLGSDADVAKFFNEIRTGLFFNFNNHYLVKVFEDVHVHWKKDHNRWRAMMMKNYFSSPWSIISLFGGLAILSFITLQAAYSIKRNT